MWLCSSCVAYVMLPTCCRAPCTLLPMTLLPVVLLAVAAALALLASSAAAFQCEPCDRFACAPPPDHCLHGHVLDVCDCCLLCAKPENATCQGPFGQFGRCADGLVCMTQPLPGEAVSEHDLGICKPAAGKTYAYRP